MSKNITFSFLLKNKKTLTIYYEEGVHEMNFLNEIKQVIQLPDKLILLLSAENEPEFKENVFAISSQAEFLWKIEKTYHLFYDHIQIEGDLINAHNTDESNLLIDPKTGRLI